MSIRIVNQEGEETNCFFTRQGFEYLAIGNSLEQAQASFERALDEESNNAFALTGLAICFRAKKEYINSLNYFKSALALDSGNINISLQFCLTLYRCNKRKNAFTELLVIIDTVSHWDRRNLCWDTFYATLHAALYDSDSNNYLKKNAQNILNILIRAPVGRRSNTYQLVFEIYSGCFHGALNSLNKILRTNHHDAINKTFELLIHLLDQLRLGSNSSHTLECFFDGLKNLLHERTWHYQDHYQTRLQIIAVLIKIRSENIHAILLKNKIEITDLPIKSFLDLLFYSVNEVIEFFNKNTLLIEGSQLPVFYLICSFCFKSANKENMPVFFQDKTLVETLRQLNSEQQNDLLFQVHQAHFNLISIGFRQLSIKFVYALAELNKQFFGTYDQFYRKGDGFLTVDWVSAFGHLIFLEILLRLEKIGLFQKIPRKICARQNELANPAVMELLESNDFKFIDVNANNSEARRWQMDYIWTEATGVMYFMDFMNLSQSQLLAYPSFTILQIPDKWRHLGTEWLLSRNIQNDDVVTVIHCREPTFWQNIYNVYSDARNVSTASYKDCINYLIEQGDSVIRIGDPGMSPIEGIESERYIDITKIDEAQSWLVFYVLSRANRFIGTNSGPAGVANIYNTPSLLTNWFPLNVHISNLNNHSLVAFKRISVDGQILPLTEMLKDPFSSNEFISSRKGGSYKLLDLSPSDLLEITREFHLRLEGLYSISEEKKNIEEQFQHFWQQEMYWKVKLPHSLLNKETE